jgi:hypothetical protein
MFFVNVTYFLVNGFVLSVLWVRVAGKSITNTILKLLLCVSLLRYNGGDGITGVINIFKWEIVEAKYNG